MKKTSAFLLAFILAGVQAMACLNDEAPISVLKPAPRVGNVPYGRTMPDKEQLWAVWHGIDKLYEQTHEVDYLADKGLVMILLGEYDTALELYQRVERERPGLYTTASNIGTTYELAGSNRLALEWLRKAVRIAPASHDSSEWLHLRILEAKIAGPQAVSSAFLIGTDFGAGVTPVSELGTEARRKLSDALYYQLRERLTFIHERDPIIALLLFDLGNLAFLQGAYRDAVADYKLAQQYGADSPTLKIRLREATRLADLRTKSLMDPESSVQTITASYGPVIGGIILLLLISALILLRRRKR